jgi:hypothetical protein
MEFYWLLTPKLAPEVAPGFLPSQALYRHYVSGIVKDKNIYWLTNDFPCRPFFVSVGDEFNLEFYVFLIPARISWSLKIWQLKQFLKDII